MQTAINQPCSFRARITITGTVQGVGFRPFVFRLATELSLNGWVNNSSQGVTIEIEGNESEVESFIHRLRMEKPSLASIHSMETTYLDPAGYTSFEIHSSSTGGDASALILPDIAVCPDCLRELFEPGDRRYLYPFINCTNCGPRFTIIESLPYDRPNTTMKHFVMCDDCRNEYENPLDRRFHAQPIACPVCGPRLELWDIHGQALSQNRTALLEAAGQIRNGNIVAVKGLGGFHLLVDARNNDAVLRLRLRKHREEKPFALMFPSFNQIASVCEASSVEKTMLHSPESPIVLLKKHSLRNIGLTENIAPSSANLGIMLPYTPLHHLLMHELGFPVVATSGNHSDEPICIDEREAIERLHEIADFFLVHNRPIKRHVDDSIVRVIAGREMVLRRARGYAPLPVANTFQTGKSILAVGAHLKNTIALATPKHVFVSQHIGDLETKEAYDAFVAVINDFKTMYQAKPETIVCDMHPDYLSTRYAEQSNSTIETVQHHYAHVASCMAENELSGDVLGVSWDGTGYGTDTTIWGGEFLVPTDASFERIATFRRFPLPGGENAITEPRRCALGLLYEVYGNSIFESKKSLVAQHFTNDEFGLLQQMLERKQHSPYTSSVGRLFDALASLTGVRQQCTFEGQAAMEIEFLAGKISTEHCYPFRFMERTHASLPMLVDWEPCFLEALDNVSQHMAIEYISTAFHNTLSEIIVEIAKRIGKHRVVLSGGCFQNAYLTERTILRLRSEGFQPYWHQRVPPNDGGIALGQIYATVRKQSNKQLS